MSKDDLSGRGEAGGRPAALDRLYADRAPPSTLEERVVDDLTRAGLLGAPHRSGPTVGPAGTWGRRVVAMAAGVLLFAAGWGAGRRPVTSTGTGEAGQRFMLLLWDAPAAGGSAETGDPARAEEYAAWARSLAERGVPISGDELASERRSLGALPVTTDDRIGGYFLLRADDFASAEALARTLPHLRYGGRVEVAPVVER